MIVYEKPLRDGLQAIIANAIRNNGNNTALSPLFESVIGCTTAITDSVRQNDPPIKPLACEAGCSHCCYQYDVGVTPFEILCIAAHILETYNKDEQAVVLDKIAMAEKKKRSLPIEDWGYGKFPCPLLVDEKCSVYEVRPLVCRAMNSYDGDRCRQNRETPRNDSSVPMYGHQYEIAKFARVGIQRGLSDVSLQNEILELVPALRIALTTSGALLRWLAGERIFEEAVSRLPPRSGRPIDKEATNGDATPDSILNTTEKPPRRLNHDTS